MNVKEKIKEASLDLLIEYGVHGTSTKMITELAGISNGALFHHFKNKDEIIVHLYKDYKQELLQVLFDELSEIRSVRTFFSVYFKTNVIWSLENSKKKLFIDMYSLTPTIRSCGDYLNEAQLSYINSFLVNSLNNGDIVAYDHDALLFNILAVVDGAVNYLNKHEDKDRDEFIEFTFNQYWRSIVNF